MICLPESLSEAVPDLIDILNAKAISFMGGVFPALIFENRKMDSGAIVKTLPAKEKPVLVRNISKEVCIPSHLGESISEFQNKCTVFVFLDGLSPGVAKMTSTLYDHLGGKVSYLGGGAGSISLQQKECVFSNDGFITDGAVLLTSSLRAATGVKHGWSRFAGPFVATKTEGNNIVELNWESAFDIYKQVLEEDGIVDLDAANFFDHAKTYPFGLCCQGNEDVVRDPIKINDQGDLVCVGEVRENSVVYILKGTKETLTLSAELATQESCLQVEQTENVRGSFIADCVSRVLFLDEAFESELTQIEQCLNKSFSLGSEGILTLGEISSFGPGYLEFFNKTLVTSILYDNQEAKSGSIRRNLTSVRDFSKHGRVA